MSIFITLLILVIVFVLAWYLIGIIPFPPPMDGIKWVFYAVLVLIAIIYLLKLAGIVSI